MGRNGYLKLAVNDERIVDPTLIRDDNKSTPVHWAVETDGLNSLPKQWQKEKYLIDQNAQGQSAYHILGCLEKLGGADPKLFTEKALLLTNKHSEKVADLIQRYGNTEHLPEDKQFYCRSRVLCHAAVILEKNLRDFDKFARAIHPDVVSQSELKEQKNQFLQNHFRELEICLSDEQMAVVAEKLGHIMLTARAGSGKTYTLVARIICMVRHYCNAPQ